MPLQQHPFFLVWKRLDLKSTFKYDLHESDFVKLQQLWLKAPSSYKIVDF